MAENHREAPHGKTEFGATHRERSPDAQDREHDEAVRHRAAHGIGHASFGAP
ncbi:hypothetical protein [Demequina litorisediminis]|uniref:hypothetical protein n=1 Tax=Demequina litorisediminis TaxID=1849022 RepID=UPI0024E0A7A3|nr:hypothetical protein [Demequina litorisediminis]